MFRIGEFSKLSRVSVTALRYYDQVGLLKPRKVDRFTGYRYYSAEQLPRLHRILVLKELGFSLEQITRLINEELPLAQIRGMLRMKQAEAQQRVDEEQARLARIEARLRQLEEEDEMPTYEVVLKRVERIHVASVREVLPSIHDNPGHLLDRIFDEAIEFVQRNGGKVSGPGIALWHDPEFRETNIDVEAAVPTHDPMPSSERVSVYELPAVETMASIVHHGSIATFNRAYDAITKWIESNGYHIVGPNREVYLQYRRNGNQADYVTEIQFPVVKP